MKVQTRLGQYDTSMGIFYIVPIVISSCGGYQYEGADAARPSGQ